MANELYQFMSEQSVATFVNQVFTKTGIRLNERIVQELNENSSDKQSLSAKALYELLNALNEADGELLRRVNANGELLGQNTQSITDLNTKQDEQDGRLDTVEENLTNTRNLVGSFQHLQIETITGSIDTVAEPNSSTLYLQRDNEADTTWKMYVLNENKVSLNEYANNFLFSALVNIGNTQGGNFIDGLSEEGKLATELIIDKSWVNAWRDPSVGDKPKAFEDNAFAGSAVTNIKFTGTEEEWNALVIGEGNDPLVNATKEFEYVIPNGGITVSANWIDVGDTELDLTGIWSKDEVEEMREALQVHDAEPIPFNDIVNLVDEVFDANQVDYRMEPEGEVEVPDVEFGTRLSDVEIRGTMMYDGVEVPGTFTWETTDEEFEQMVNAE